MAQFTTLTSRALPLLANNVDTDQIIPARFLKATDKTGLGECVFYDWRHAGDGSLKADFVLNRPDAKGAHILLAGDNFGCGSSREHAAWALTGFGFRAVISTSFADIFRNNALKNGLLPVALDAEGYGRVRELIERSPDASLTVSLADQTVSLPDGSWFGFPIDGFSKACLINGTDELGYLLQFEDGIRAYEALHAGDTMRRPA